MKNANAEKLTIETTITVKVTNDATGKVALLGGTNTIHPDIEPSGQRSYTLHALELAVERIAESYFLDSAVPLIRPDRPASS